MPYLSSVTLAAFALVATAQGAGISSEHDPNTLTPNCDSLFEEFAELPVHPPERYLGYKVPEPLMVLDKLVDLDSDGDPDRILLARYGLETDITKGPSTVIVAIGEKNPAFASLDKQSATALFRPANIQSSAEHDFQYLSFDEFLFRFEIPDAKQVHEPWTAGQYQEYFKSLNFPEELTAATPVSLRPTLARVGYIGDRPFLLLSAKPIEYDETRTQIVGYDVDGRYIGRRFEFLASYKGARRIELYCARQAP